MSLEQELKTLAEADGDETEVPPPHATWSPMPFGRPDQEADEDEPLEFAV